MQVDVYHSGQARDSRLMVREQATAELGARARAPNGTDSAGSASLAKANNTSPPSSFNTLFCLEQEPGSGNSAFIYLISFLSQRPIRDSFSRSPPFTVRTHTQREGECADIDMPNNLIT